jgi:hypothetical protein
MAFAYKIHSEKKFIWLEWNGTFDLEAIKIHTANMYADALYQPEFKGLCDARQANFQLNDNGILKVQEFVANHPNHPTGPWAVICSEPLQTAYAMIYEHAENPPHPIRVFCTEEAALEWLAEFEK